MFCNEETKGIFWYEVKKIEKKLANFFQLKTSYGNQKLKIQFLKTNILLIIYNEI